MARTRTTYTGDPGEVWTNESGKVQFQFIANWINTCGLCCQFDHQIGASWPIPLHRSCRCKQILVAPGQSAQPFTDFHETISKLDPIQQSRVVGRSNLTLIEQGIVKWEDVVTRTRVRDLREVVARGGLSVKQMVKVGVNPRLAAEAYTTVHTPAHELAAAQRQTLLDQLAKTGLTKDQVRQALAERLAARVGIGQGPSGPGPSPIVPGTPSPKPPPIVPPVLPARAKKKPTPIPLPIPLISGGSPEAIEKAYLQSLGVKDEAIAKVQPADLAAKLREDVLAADGNSSEQARIIHRFLAKNQKPAAEQKHHGMTDPELMHSVEIGGLTIHYQAPNARDAADAAKGHYETQEMQLVRRLMESPALPPELARRTTDVYMTKQANSADVRWKERFNNPNFASSATGGDGQVVVYRGIAPTLRILTHEMGHNLAQARYGDVTPESSSHYRNAMRSGEAAPTEYGKHNPAEDFAEGVMEYVDNPQEFSANWPKRAAVLKKMLEDPDYAG